MQTWMPAFAQAVRQAVFTELIPPPTSSPKTNASDPKGSPAGSVRSISRTAARRCPIGMTRVELVLVLRARRIIRRYLPVASASPSCHCSFRSSPIRQPVESVAMINAARAMIPLAEARSDPAIRGHRRRSLPGAQPSSTTRRLPHAGRWVQLSSNARLPLTSRDARTRGNSIAPHRRGGDRQFAFGFQLSARCAFRFQRSPLRTRELQVGSPVYMIRIYGRSDS